LRGIEAEIDRAQAYCALLAGARGIVRNVHPPLGSHHPAEVVSSALSQAFDQAKHAQKEIHLLATVAALREVEQLAPPGVTARIGEKIESLQAWGRRAALETWLRRGKRVALLGLPYAGVLVVGLVLGLLLGSSSAERRVGEEVAKLAESTGFTDPDLRRGVQQYLTDESRADEARVAFLSDWGKLRRRLKRTAPVTCTQWIGALEVARDGEMLDGRTDLQEEFRKDLALGGTRALEALFREGGSALAATAGAGPGVRATVELRLVELQTEFASLQRPIGVGRDIGTLVRGLPGILDRLELAEAVDREALPATTAGLREEFEDLARRCPNLGDARPELVRWLGSELRDALVRELAQRARQAARPLSDRERARFTRTTDAILSACVELASLDLPRLARPDGDLEEWSWRETATEAVATSLPEGTG
jgi:hypothetical protein